VPTFLVVDDHLSFRRQARALLASQGHVVVGEAGDGQSAIEAAAVLGPDVVLVDIGLPDIDGFEVARRLTDVEHPPTVVLTSSRDASAYGPLIGASPAAGFVAKDELAGPALVALLASRCGART
jgi:DNA-binding NarL/FixJ family response regulator